MAKKRNKTRTARDLITIANRTVARPIKLRPWPSPSQKPIIIGDRRRFEPTHSDPIVSTSGGAAPSRRVAGKKWQAIGFDTPTQVPLCQRRKKRKQVLFALNRTGKGSKSRRKYNQWSNIKC